MRTLEGRDQQTPQRRFRGMANTLAFALAGLGGFNAHGADAGRRPQANRRLRCAHPDGDVCARV